MGWLKSRIIATEPTGITGAASRTITRHIESLFDGGSIAGLSDAQLLERFNAGDETAAEAAFAALVARHGPMVLRICVSVVDDRDHAEDAFQAVFLVLAQGSFDPRRPPAGHMAVRRVDPHNAEREPGLLGSAGTGEQHHR